MDISEVYTGQKVVINGGTEVATVRKIDRDPEFIGYVELTVGRDWVRVHAKGLTPVDPEAMIALSNRKVRA